MAAPDDQNKKERFWSKFSHLGKKEKSLFVKLGICLLAGIILMNLGGGKQKTESPDYSNETTTQQQQNNQYTAQSYAAEEKELEEKLTNILSQIKGAGAVSVALTLEQGTEYVYAEENNKKTAEDQSESSSSLAQINDSPVLLKERLPEVKGVVIVAEGAGNILVEERLYQAAKSLLGLSASQIAIIEGTPTATETVETEGGTL